MFLQVIRGSSDPVAVPASCLGKHAALPVRPLIEGSRRRFLASTGSRILIAAFVLGLLFAIIGVRLAQLGLVERRVVIDGREVSEIEASRPPIVDRNGLEMALDLRVPSLFAEPRRIVDPEQATDAILTVLEDLDREWLVQRLTGEAGFVWIKREISPDARDRIMRLGIPGIDFLSESKRFYPSREASHVLGTVDIDSKGIAGIERNIDGDGVALLQELGIARDQELTPVQLSLDVRVQHAMYTELVDGMTRYKSIASAGVILDARSGEVIALASLPDFDPNVPSTAVAEGRFNRITAGNFELGSVIKTVTFAAALDSGAVSLRDRYDSRFPVRFGRFSITDFKGQNRILTVPEIYRYSSNVGTIQIMQTLGKDNLRAFMSTIGFDRPIETELPERTPPKVPSQLSEVVAATASFGHGFSISPMHLARAMAAFVNGGLLVDPTFYPRDKETALANAQRVISRRTSEKIRFLMRLNALEGSASRMNKLAAGYRAGGKTGTAEKVVEGRYGTGKNLNVFASAFPLESPQYVMVVLLDEAEPENAQSGNTAGWNAGEVSGRIIARVAPMLGIAPDSNPQLDEGLITPVSAELPVDQEERLRRLFGDTR
ncbi:MAG: penicillin-binding protein 2 [Devosia sp.]|nr:penicillin-binding protein 2 [Devosia sp.]